MADFPAEVKSVTARPLNPLIRKGFVALLAGSPGGRFQVPVAAVVNEERRLTLAEVVQALIADGLVPREEAERLIADRRAYRAGAQHPLVVIAEQKWRAAPAPHKLLTLEALTEWYAPKAELPYFHIDPLKINFAAVTELMSSAYAERF
jgi:general secretion pathway protein E